MGLAQDPGGYFLDVSGDQGCTVVRAQEGCRQPTQPFQGQLLTEQRVRVPCANLLHSLRKQR